MSSSLEIPVQAAQTISELLGERARESPDAPAIVAAGLRDLSYRDLLEEVRDSVRVLNHFGFSRKDRIAVTLPPGSEWPTALASVMSACVSVPLNPDYSVEEFVASFTNTRVAGVLAIPDDTSNAVKAARRCRLPIIELRAGANDQAGRFELSCESCHSAVKECPAVADDLAAIFATSGTTSSSKLIPLTHAMISSRALRARNFVDLQSTDRCLDLMPSFHGGAILIPILGTMFAGASSMHRRVPSPAEFEDCIREMRPTWCALPPPFVEMLLADGFEWYTGTPPAGLRAFFTGGAPMSAETVARIEARLGVPVQNSYGATECGGIAAMPLPPKIRKRGSVGVSIGLELAIMGEWGAPLASDHTGEVVVRGPGVFQGYEKARGSENSPFWKDWYRTGDLGHLDSDGYLFLSGRLKELINRGGEKISPEEVEAVLREHPSVADAAVFPIPHKTLGQDVAAVIVASAGSLAQAEGLPHFLGQRLAGFKIPRPILTVEKIPLGPGGKIKRNQLATIFAKELATARAVRDRPYHPPETGIQELIADHWRKILKTDRIGIHDRFFDCGGDSLLAASMLSEIGRKCGRAIPMDQFWETPTIENLAKLVIYADYRKSSVLVRIQPAGSRKPLFYIPPAWFGPEAETLSRYLGDDQPVYALIPDARPGAGQSGYTREQIVSKCVEAMESVQSEGPYMIVGRSSAGLLAFEIAQAMAAAGKTVGVVGLLDTHYPGVTRNKKLPAPLRDLEHLLGELVLLPPSQLGKYLLRVPLRLVRRAWRALRKRPTSFQIANQSLQTGLERLFCAAPKTRYPGRVVLFAAESSKHRGFLDRRLYWSHAAEHGVEVHLIPGNHNSMVQEPHVQYLAQALKGCMERAEEAARAH